MRERFHPYLWWLPKWAKNLLTSLKLGDVLLEYCTDCGVEQPEEYNRDHPDAKPVEYTIKNEHGLKT